jgi:glycopeptide antibiotics resistance protein
MFLKHNRYGLLWALLILILCGIPGKDLPHSDFLDLLNFDKLVHAGIFFVQVVMLIHGFRKQTAFAFLGRHAGIIATALSVIYGGLMELMQGALFSDRSPDINDFIANSFGCVAGWMVFNIINRKILSKHLR